MSAIQSISPTTVYLATRSHGKLTELKSLALSDALQLRLATDLDPDISWDETGDTFVANARIKAMVVRALTAEAVLADDSGLEVDFLGGKPGVYSSRFAGESASDTENNRHLLKLLTGVPEFRRQARFVCCLVFLDREGNEQMFSGYCPGRIAFGERGNLGFGYDSLFVPDGYGKTLGEFNPDEKNQVSHRASAVRQWLNWLALLR